MREERRASSRPRLLVGSSSTRTRQPTAMARAISTICCTGNRTGSPTNVSGLKIAVPELAQGAASRSPPSRRGGESRSRVGSTPSRMFSVNGEMRRERQLLVDHRHARAAGLDRASRRVGLAVDRHRPLVRLDGARRGSPSACSCRRRSRRRGRRSRRRQPRGRRDRARPSRRSACAMSAHLEQRARLSFISAIARGPAMSSAFISG